jgi:hypothetical protein
LVEIQELGERQIAAIDKSECDRAATVGAASDVVGIWRGAISGNMKVSFQAARSIG